MNLKRTEQEQRLSGDSHTEVQRPCEGSRIGLFHHMLHWERMWFGAKVWEMTRKTVHADDLQTVK